MDFVAYDAPIFTLLISYMTQKTERKMSQTVLQITSELGFFHAELARILGLKCPDIGQIACGKEFIQTGTQSWQQALLLIEFNHLLEQLMQGDSVKMYQWIRHHHKIFNATPHAMMIDKYRISEVVRHLKKELSSL